MLTMTIVAIGFLNQGSAAIITNPAQIQDGDLLLGFDVATNGIGTLKNVLIDLGQYSTLGSLGSVNLSADLTQVYGASFATAGIKYGVIGVTDNNTTYLTTPTQGKLYTKLNAPQSGIIQGNYLQPLDVGAVNTGALGYDLTYAYQTTTHGGYISSSDPNSWSTQNPSTAPFGFYGGSTMETTLGSSLNYLDIMPVSSSVSAATQVGSFNISSAGVLTYAAIPEPSACALISCGFLVLIAVVTSRRKSVVSKNS